MPAYGDPKYWDETYKQSRGEALYDWLESYETLKGVLSLYLKNQDMRILVLGCGNAAFSEDLYDHGFKNQVNVDISSIVIEQMQERNAENRPEIQWITMDITNMNQFETGSFDIALDKGTLDAIKCGDYADYKIAQMMKETQRVLKVGGHYFFCSYGDPPTRAYHFVQPYLSFENQDFILYDSTTVSEQEKFEKCHFIYISKKLPDADEVSDRFYAECLQLLLPGKEVESKPDLKEESKQEGGSGAEESKGAGENTH